MKFKQWRNAVVKHLFEHGPAGIETLHSDLRNREGMKWGAHPTVSQSKRALKLDKRIICVDEEYGVDLIVLKEIKWERW